MTEQAPPTKRRFANVADEIEYVYQKLMFWFCQNRDSVRTRRYAARLKRLLVRDATVPGSIPGEEFWSIIFEVEGDIRKAIRHREREIRLIRRLHALTSEEQRPIVFAWYGYDDLSDRLIILADLYDRNEQTDRAIRILRESKALCLRHGIPFDGEDILEELLSDPAPNGTRNGRLKAKTR